MSYRSSYITLQKQRVTANNLEPSPGAATDLQDIYPDILYVIEWILVHIRDARKPVPRFPNNDVCFKP